MAGASDPTDRRQTHLSLSANCRDWLAQGRAARQDWLSRTIEVRWSDTQLLFLSPYSPDLDPIENAFSGLKALLRKAAVRTIDDLSTVIGQILDAFTPSDCASHFAAAGYDAR